MAASLAPLAEEHLDSILEVQAKSPGAAQWSCGDYVSLLRSGACGWVASNGKGICGFLCARANADEMEILNLAVDPASRRQGIGSILLDAAMAGAKQEGVSKVHLEVRALNHAARRFYEARGFRQTGARPNYYRDPVDDALLLSADVT